MSGCAIHEMDNLKPSMASTADGQVLPRSELGLLAFSNYLDGLSNHQFSKELALARDNYKVDDDSYNTLRLALVYMQPNAELAGSQRAERLLRSYINGTSTREQQRVSTFGGYFDNNTGYETLATFLLKSVEQRQSLVEENISLQQKIEQLMFIENHLSQP